MPLGEIAGSALGVVARDVGHLVVEVALELLIKGPGWRIARTLDRSADPDGALTIVSGVIFWSVVLGIGYAVYVQLQ